ncbi:MAG: hypothetical protein AAB721_00070, partial [Patescibacteria group bacterium]
SDYRALQIDHILGNGSKERKKNNTTKIYHKIVNKQTKGYQLLCANCNWIKRYTNKEYRKK